MEPDPGNFVSNFVQNYQRITSQYYGLIWIVLIGLFVLWLVWPKLRDWWREWQYHRTYRSTTTNATELEEGMRLARLAQQEKLREVAKEVAPQQQQKKDSKWQPRERLKRGGYNPLMPSSGGGGNYRPPSCSRPGGG